MAKQEKPFLIYQLGTNNWQREGEFAPGSGILHEAHHNAYNKMKGVKCYSLYPSQFQTPHPDPQIEVFKLDHQIPICESAGPVSSYRWHTMSESDFQAYKTRLEEAVCSQLEKIEEIEGCPVQLCIAHHTFLNPLVLRNVIQRRVKEGKSKPSLACFAHGTALKMFKHEKDGKNQEEFYSRFLPLMKEEKVFQPSEDENEVSVEVCYAISNQQVDALNEIFPEFPADKVVVSPNGVNLDIFHEIKNLELKKFLKTFKHWNYEGSDRNDDFFDTSKVEHLVFCCSRLADWKRIDVLLKAMKIVQQKIPTAAVAIAGSGPLEAQKLYQDLAFKELGLENTIFLGPQPQPKLAQLYSVADVGCVCSHKEPFGMVFIECMACGTPVIAANSGGPKDFVSPEVGALVEESEDREELAKRFSEAILDAISNDWKAEKKENCKKLALEKYSVNVQCAQLLEDTKKLLNLNNSKY